MKNLAPEILRQRLLIEGFYTTEVNETVIKNYFEQITKELELRMYAEPIIHSTGGLGKEDNQGFDAFVPLIDSGISVYVWTKQKFFSTIIYTCKKFDEVKAIKTTKNFFGIQEIVQFSF